MPTWVKVAVDAWTEAAGVAEGHVLRRIARGDQVRPERMSEKVVWKLLQPYAVWAGVPGIAPHDLRRSCAKMCRAAGGELEQIQILLGHASVQTTERYLGTKQDLVHAPNDGIRFRVAVWLGQPASVDGQERSARAVIGHILTAGLLVIRIQACCFQSSQLFRLNRPCKAVGPFCTSKCMDSRTGYLQSPLLIFGGRDESTLRGACIRVDPVPH
jgi:hypothetical protein